jgi:hypothetical protein
LNVGFIGAQNERILGITHTRDTHKATIKQCFKGALDAAVVMLKSGKAGCNLQGMNWMVSLLPISIDVDEQQAKGPH